MVLGFANAPLTKGTAYCDTNGSGHCIPLFRLIICIAARCESVLTFAARPTHIGLSPGMCFYDLSVIFLSIGKLFYIMWHSRTVLSFS